MTTGDDPAPRAARDRQVVLVGLVIVGGVLGLNVLSVLVPALGDLLGGLPVLIVGLIAVTLIVLIAAFRRR